MVYVLPSDPVTVTEVAFVADTVNVDELPAVIVAGLEVMLTVGVVGVVLKVAPPHPVNSRGSESVDSIANGERIRGRSRAMRTCIMVFSFLCSRKQRWPDSQIEKWAQPKAVHLTARPRSLSDRLTGSVSAAAGLSVFMRRVSFFPARVSWRRGGTRHN
jgi:hypothetical protein